MELGVFFENVIEYADKPIVFCDLDYRIVYMNRKAEEEYTATGARVAVGSSLRVCFDEESQSKIDMSVEWFKEGKANNKVFAFHKDEDNSDVYIKAVRDSEDRLIGFYNYIMPRSTETGKAYDLD